MKLKNKTIKTEKIIIGLNKEELKKLIDLMESKYLNNEMFGNTKLLYNKLIWSFIKLNNKK